MLATRLDLSNTAWHYFGWPLQSGGIAAEFAELAVGLLLTAAVIKIIAHDRAAART